MAGFWHNRGGMKIKINGWFWGVLFILSLFSLNGLEAATPVGDRAKLIQTESLVPLSVSTTDGPSADSLFVEVFALRAVDEPAQSRFSWFDQNKVPVGSYTAGMSKKPFVGLRKIRIPTLEFVGDYTLQVDIFAAGGKLLATGQQAVTIDSGSERLKLSAPTLIREPDGFRLGYDLENYNLTQTVVPRLQGFYLKDGERQYILQRVLDPVKMSSRAEVEIEFLVEEDFPPGEYYLETWIESPSGRYLSGVVESYLQMPGSYARLAALDVQFINDSSKEAEIAFEGFALLPPNKDLQVQVQGEYDGKILAKKTMSVPVSNGYFVDTMDFKLPQEVPFFSGRVSFFADGDLDLGRALLTQSFNSPVVKAQSTDNGSGASDLGSNTTDFSLDEGADFNLYYWEIGKMLLVLLGVFILFFVFFLMLKKFKRKKKVFGILLAIGLGFSMFSSVPAEAASCTWEVATETIPEFNRSANRCRDFQPTGSRVPTAGQYCAGALYNTGVRTGGSSLTHYCAGVSTCQPAGALIQTERAPCRDSARVRGEPRCCSGSAVSGANSCQWNCEGVPVPSVWTTSAWSSCSEACGPGTQTRTVACLTGNCAGLEPVSSQSCNEGSCATNGEWTSGSWGSCSVTCGGGTQTRSVTCEFTTCNGAEPDSAQACNTDACASTCDPDDWSGEDPAAVCTGQPATQTNACGSTRQIDGTWDPADWGPDPGTVCSFETFYQGTSCGEAQSVQGTLDCQPSWQWLRPATPTPLVSTSNTSDYTTIKVSGSLYYPVANEGFFDVNTIRAVRVVLISGATEYEYSVLLSDVVMAGDRYDFILDLNDIANSTPAGQSGPVALADGDWGVDVMFEHRHDGMTGYEWVRNAVSGSLQIDSSAPALEIAHKKTATPEAEAFADGELSNEAGWLALSCTDAGPAGCVGALIDADIDGAVDDYAPFAVKGNFCADGNTCDAAATRTFRLCDLVQNCVDQSVELDHYDPIAPSALNFGLALELGERLFRTAFKAGADYFPNLEYVDPDEVESSSTPSVVGSRAYISEAEYNQLFDPNACGAGSVFTENGTDGVCELASVNYPPTCEDIGNCPDPCGAGFYWDDTTSSCVAESSCTDTSWSPDVTAICDGTSFTQVSNCGSAQAVDGTKNCSAPTTGDWETGAWGSCSAACGGGAQTRTVTCGFDNCNGPQPTSLRTCNTQSCSTAGAWTKGTWGSCSTTCGGGTQARTVTCDFDTCTGTEPAPSQSCNTQACPEPLPTPSSLLKTHAELVVSAIGIRWDAGCPNDELYNYITIPKAQYAPYDPPGCHNRPIYVIDKWTGELESGKEYVYVLDTTGNKWGTRTMYTKNGTVNFGSRAYNQGLRPNTNAKYFDVRYFEAPFGAGSYSGSFVYNGATSAVGPYKYQKNWRRNRQSK